MAVTADSVVVELEAKTEGYNAKINAAAKNFDNATKAMVQSSAQAEGALRKLVEASVSGDDRIALRRQRLAKQLAASTGEVAGQTAQAANATRNLGRQIGDIGTGLATGQNPFFIIAQQSAQVADALADTGGKAAKVATFFAGPWGAALLAAGSALGILIGKALEGGDSVESLTKKLQENAAKTALNERAQFAFSQTTEGLTVAVNELSKALDAESASSQRAMFMTAAKAEADRQATVRARQRAAAELSTALAQAEGARATAQRNAGQGVGGLAGNASNIALAGADAKVVELRTKLAQATENVAKAETNVVKAQAPIIRNQVAESMDAATKATGQYERALDRLFSKLKRGQITQEQYRAGVSQATATRDTALEAAREANRKGRRGPSAETLARRAEAQRLREVRQDNAFEQEKVNLDDALLSARGRQVRGIEEQADAAIAEADSENAKRKRRYESARLEGRLSEAEQDELNLKSDAIAAQQKLNANLDKQVALARQNEQLAIGERNAAAATLEAQLGVTLDRSARQKLEADILELKYEERRLQLEANLADARRNKDKVAEANAQAALANLPAEKRADQFQAARNARNPYQVYRDNLEDGDRLSDELDGLKVQTLEAVTDELTNATKAALGLSGAFGDVVGQLIKIGIQRKLIGPLADQLFGKADGSTGGSLGGLFSSIGTFLGGGRASGGDVRAGQIYKINENGPELFRPAQSGKIYPTGSLNAASGRGGNTTIVQQSFTLDARYGITTPQLLQHVNKVATQKAAQAGQAAYQNSPARVQQLQTLGT